MVINDSLVLYLGGTFIFYGFKQFWGTYLYSQYLKIEKSVYLAE